MPLNILIRNKYQLRELKKMIETTVYSGETVVLNFLDVEVISEKEYKEIYFDVTNIYTNLFLDLWN